MNKKQKLKQIKKFMLVTAVLLIIVLIWPSPMVQAADTDNDGITDSTENSLAARFAPTLYFKAGENFFPVDVDYHISNSNLYNRPTGTEQPAVFVSFNPLKTTLDDYPGQYHLLRNMIGDYEAIKTHYTTNIGLWPYHIYCHVMNDSGYTFVQYWFFYAYNDGSINQHEGDWEMISIMLSNTEPMIPLELPILNTMVVNMLLGLMWKKRVTILTSTWLKVPTHVISALIKAR